jgi:hypothetical protein
MNGEIAMKTITSALVALLVIAGVAGTAQAFDAKAFYEQVDRNHNWQAFPALGTTPSLPTQRNVTASIRGRSMKTLLSAFLALSVLSGYAATAMADKVPPSIWEQLDRDGHGGLPTWAENLIAQEAGTVFAGLLAFSMAPWSRSWRWKLAAEACSWNGPSSIWPLGSKISSVLSPLR